MAPAKKDATEVSPVKTVFMCCATKSSSIVICVKCGNIFHYSCAVRDWSEKVSFLEKNRVLCCADPFEFGSDEVTNNTGEDENISYLKRLVEELTDKNKLLQENSILWKEKYEALLENTNKTDISRQKQEGKQTSPLPPPTPPPPNSQKIVDVDALIIISDKNETLPTPGGSRSDAPTDIAPKATESGDIDLQAPVLCPSVDVLTLTDEIKTKTKESKKAGENTEITVILTESEGLEWETQKKRGFNRKIRPAPVQGKKDGPTTLKIAPKAPKYSWLFLSGLSEDSTAHEVGTYLRENGVEKCITEKLHTKRQHVSCFKIGVPEENESEVLGSDFWPKGLFINKFLNLKRLVPQQRRGKIGKGQV